MTTPFETAITKLGMNRAPEENDQAVLQRLVKAINDDDDIWDDLPEPVQDWYHECVEAFNAANGEDVELPLLEGVEKKAKANGKRRPKKSETPVEAEAKAEVVETAVAEPEVTEEQEVVTETKIVEEDTTDVVTTEEKPAKAKKSKKESASNSNRGSSSMAYAVRQVIAENYEIALSDLMDKLEERGIEMKKSAASSVHINTVRILEMIHKQGLEIKDAEGNVVIKAV